MAKQPRQNMVETRKDPNEGKMGPFPAAPGEGAFEKAQKQAAETSLTDGPLSGSSAKEGPKGKPKKRKKNGGEKEKPTPPEARREQVKEASPEVQRKQALSAALLKGAAFVQPSGRAATLQGLLSGAGVGMEIDAALQHYRDQKKQQTMNNAAKSMHAPTPEIKTPANFPMPQQTQTTAPPAGSQGSQAANTMDRAVQGAFPAKPMPATRNRNRNGGGY